jgi:lysophospholipase L1-like esterase
MHSNTARIVRTLGVLMALVVAGEVAIRVWMNHCGQEQVDVWRLEDGKVMWAVAPNQSIVKQSEGICPFAEKRYRIVTNEDGFRDASFDAAPLGTLRIFSMGDSETWGDGVETGDTYSALLEASLRRQGQDVDVMNLGVQGYDTLRELIQYRAYAARFTPSAVILAIDPNDFAPPYPLAHLAPGEFRYYRSGIWMMGKALYEVALGDVEGDWSQSIEAMRSMRAEMKAPVYLLLLDSLNGRAIREIRDWEASSQDVHLVDCAGEVNGNGHRFERNGHLNAEGHRLVAECLEPRVLASLAR